MTGRTIPSPVTVRTVTPCPWSASTHTRYERPANLQEKPYRLRRSSCLRMERRGRPPPRGPTRRDRKSIAFRSTRSSNRSAAGRAATLTVCTVVAALQSHCAENATQPLIQVVLNHEHWRPHALPPLDE